MGVSSAVRADRPQKQLMDPAMPSGSDDEQIGHGAQFDQRRPSFRSRKVDPTTTLGATSAT
jgi:hypothetical protein